MKLSSGLPFSLIRYGLPFNYPKLESDMKTEVVIIGGGISGALNAFYLTEAGIDCVVVDKRTIGLGSTAACTSLLQYEIDVSLNDLIAERGEQDAVRAYQLCNDAIYTMENICKQINFHGFQRTDSLFYGASKKDEERLVAECEKRKSIGLDVEYLSAKKLKSKFGIEAFGAILSQNAAYADAYSLTHALLQHSITKGLRIFDRTEITSIRENQNEIEVVTKDLFKIKTRHVVYATGYETIEKIRSKIIKLRSTYATVSESFADCESLHFHRTLLWNTADPYLYMRCTRDGRIIVGGRDDLYLSATKRDNSIALKTRQLIKDFNKLFPSIPFIPEFSWAGTFATTRDGLPFIGCYPGKKNSYYALGFGGNGIIFSLIAAEIIGDIIRGRKNDAANLFRFDRD